MCVRRGARDLSWPYADIWLASLETRNKKRKSKLNRSGEPLLFCFFVYNHALLIFFQADLEYVCRYNIKNCESRFGSRKPVETRSRHFMLPSRGDLKFSQILGFVFV